MEAGSVSVSRGLDTDTTATLDACAETLGCEEDEDEDADGSLGLVMLALRIA